MNVGVTGHQKRPGINWFWVSEVIRKEFLLFSSKLVGLSSLAQGADQVFAEIVLESKGDLHFVQPTEDYQKTFDGEHLSQYLRLKSFATTITKLPLVASDQEAYLAAGKYITNHSDLLIAIWDGKTAAGKGGTADIVDFAKSQGKNVFHIEPICKEVRYI